MSQENDLKSQRDRFLAFAFAAADVLIEIDQAGKILFTSGATKAVTGRDDKDLAGVDFAKLFSAQDAPLIATVRNNARQGTKQGPYLVTIETPADNGGQKRVFLSTFTLIPHGSVYVTIVQGDGMLRILGFDQDDTVRSKIASADNFEEVVQKKIADILAKNQSAHIQLLQLEGLEASKGKLDPNSWANMMASIAELVMQSSLDGDAAVKIDNGKYLYLEDGDGLDNKIQDKIMDIARQYNLGDSLDVRAKKVEGDLQTLTAREASRAIMYTMTKMEKSGLADCGDNLKETFERFLNENAGRITNLKRIISKQEFKLNFQPIVSLENRELSHYEVLVRFDKDASPYDLITMGEDVGMAPDIDLAILRRALKYVDFHSEKSIAKLAVNLSGVSIQNEQFVDKLLATLGEYQSAAKHILFEITESSEITDLERVNTLIQRIRQVGYAVCLDDFGAGAASFQYLHKLMVDGIKIDGAYVRSILTSPRDATMVRNVTKMCHELGVYVVAEMIETEEQAHYLRDIGVDKGQGWLFGKPGPDAIA